MYTKTLRDSAGKFIGAPIPSKFTPEGILIGVAIGVATPIISKGIAVAYVNNKDKIKKVADFFKF
jgi:hypothetical protein